MMMNDHKDPDRHAHGDPDTELDPVTQVTLKGAPGSGIRSKTPSAVRSLSTRTSTASANAGDTIRSRRLSAP